jgi:hypothetical protein
MSLPRVSLFAVVLALSATVSQGAGAQGFFERLFGIRPAPVPPGSVPAGHIPPGAVPPGAWPPGALPPPGNPEEAVAPGTGMGMGQSNGPPPARPVAMRPASEDTVLGREVRLNGIEGSLRIDRAGIDLKAQVTLRGAKISQPTESCSVKLGDGQPLPLSNLGKPDGAPRYELQAPLCPIVFEIVEGGVLVSAPAQACVIREADCQVEPRGMWGPEPASLIARARDIEQARGAADRAVRENYKALTQRARPQDVRPIVSEQAAFSSEREQTCRSYAREGVHGFCNTRFTEARAVTLASRLGLLTTAETRPERARRPRPTSTQVFPAEAVPPAGNEPVYIR